MRFPSSTGAVAAFLGTHEPRLNGLIRRGKLPDAPPVVSGRRQWSRQHVLLAASALGIPAETVEASLDQLSPTYTSTQPKAVL